MFKMDGPENINLLIPGGLSEILLPRWMDLVFELFAPGSLPARPLLALSDEFEAGFLGAPRPDWIR
jgi:hypothetical protein